MIRVGITMKVPCRVHHLCKVKIIIDSCTNISIVLLKFFECNRLVWVLPISNIVMLFECFKELTKYLFMSLSALNHRRVL